MTEGNVCPDGALGQKTDFREDLQNPNSLGLFFLSGWHFFLQSDITETYTTIMRFSSISRNVSVEDHVLKLPLEALLGMRCTPCACCTHQVTSNLLNITGLFASRLNGD